MNLCDVVVYQGDEVLARECYARAMSIDPHAAMIVAEEQQRLALKTTRKTSRGLQPKS